MTVVLLAAGFGSAGTMMSILGSLRYRPSGIPTPADLRFIVSNTRYGAAGFSRQDESFLLSMESTLGPIATTRLESMTLTKAGNQLSLTGEEVSAGYFDVLRVTPAQGRFLTSADIDDGELPIVVSQSAAKRLGGIDSVLGQKVDLSPTGYLGFYKNLQTTYRVVGLVPDSFVGLSGQWRRSDYWRLRVPQVSDSDRSMSARGFGRFGSSESEIKRVRQQLAAMTRLSPPAANFDKDAAWDLSQEPRGIPPELLGGLYPRDLYLAIVAIACCICLAAGVNAAGLCRVSAWYRRKEYATKRMLGATLRVIVEEALAEIVIVVACAMALGYLFAQVFISAIRLSVPTHIGGDLNPIVPLAIPVALDQTAVASVVGAAVLIAVAMAIVHVSALRMSSQRNIGASHSADLLVVLPQIAVCGALTIIASGVGMRVFALDNTDLGFSADRLVFVDFDLPIVTQQAGSVTSANMRLQVNQALLTLAAGSPYVQDAALASAPPDQTRSSPVSVEREGSDAVTATIETLFVSPSYFHTMGLGVIGREFSEQDGPRSELVAIVSKAFADKFLSNSSVLGRRLNIGGNPAGSARQFSTVVGLVDNVNDMTGNGRPRAMVYVPLNQQLLPWATTLIGRLTPGAQAAGLRDVVQRSRASYSALKINRSATMTETLRALRYPRHAMSAVLVACASFGFLLALSGVSAIVARTVVERRREMAIRLAIGSSHLGVSTLFAAQVLRTVGAGLSGAVILAAWAGTVLMQKGGVGIGLLGGAVGLALSAAVLGAVAVAIPAVNAWRVRLAEELRSL